MFAIAFGLNRRGGVAFDGAALNNDAVDWVVVCSPIVGVACCRLWLLMNMFDGFTVVDGGAVNGTFDCGGKFGNSCCCC